MREMKHYVSAAIVSFITLLSSIPSAHATFIENTFGLSNPHSTITFDEHILPYLTRVTTEYSDLGVTFSPYGLYFDVANNGISGISNFVPNGFGGDRFPIGINFTNPQTEAAFAFTSASGTTTFQAFLGGNLVESVSNIATGIQAYYGFRDITFDAISIATSGPSCVFAICPQIVDNIQLPIATPPAPSAIPEPSSILGLLAFSTLGAGAILKRKLKQSQQAHIPQKYDSLIRAI
jgi:hypothetical protein